MKGQSILEMAVLAVVIITALILMAGYIKRGANGRMYEMAKSLSDGVYSPDADYSYNSLITKNISIFYNVTQRRNVVTGRRESANVEVHYLANDEYREESVYLGDNL